MITVDPTDVRIVATDLDGTLLRSDGSIGERTRKALVAADDAGLIVTFVTGRPPRWIDTLADDAGRVGVAIGANGAVLYDLQSESIVSTHPIAADAMRAIAARLRGDFPDVLFATEYGHGFAAEHGYTHDWQISPLLDRQGNAIAPPLIADLATITAPGALKLLAKDRSTGADAFLAAADALVDGLATVTHSSSFGLLEISAPGVTKASGLAELAARHGVLPHQVVAVGDMPNDVPMLEWAGRSYAVADAHPTARAAADEIIGSNDDEAVAELIESLL